MKFHKKSSNQIDFLKDCINTVKGYFYLIEMNLILMEMEYEYDAVLQYEKHFDYNSKENEYTRH